MEDEPKHRTPWKCEKLTDRITATLTILQDGFDILCQPINPNTPLSTTGKCPRAISVFHIIDIKDLKGAKTVLLKAGTGWYVAAERNGDLVANRLWFDDWEKFTKIDHGPFSFSLKSFHGKWVTSDGFTGRVKADGASVNDAAQFHYDVLTQQFLSQSVHLQGLPARTFLIPERATLVVVGCFSLLLFWAAFRCHRSTQQHLYDASVQLEEAELMPMTE